MPEAKSIGNPPRSSVQNVAAVTDSDFKSRYLQVLLAQCASIMADANKNDKLDMQQRVAEKIINNRRSQTLYADIFIDRGLNGMELNYPRWDVAGVAMVTPVEVTTTAPHTNEVGDIIYLCGLDSAEGGHSLNDQRYIVLANTGTKIDLGDMRFRPISGLGLKAHIGGGHVYRDQPKDTEINQSVTSLMGDNKFLLDFIDLF